MNAQDADRRIVKGSWLVLPVLALIATRFWILAYFEPLGSDADYYCQQAIKAVDGGLVPYSSELPIEYPPLSFRVLTLPRVFAHNRLAPDEPITREMFDRLLREYLPVHRGMMAVFDAASFVLLLLIVRRRRPELVVWSAWGYVLLTTIFANLILERLDVGLLFFLLLWAWAWTAASDRRFDIWQAVAWAALGFGAAYKLVPILAVPVLLVGQWRGSERIGRFRSIASALAVFAVTFVGPFAFEALRAGPAVLSFFTYHSERGLHIESVLASALLPLKLLGMSMGDEWTHRSLELMAPGAALLAKASTWLLAAIVMGTTLWMACPRCRADRSTAYRLALWTIAASLVFSKVLSPQFFIWGLPLLMLLGVEVCGKREFAGFMALLVAIAGLTTWIYPYHYTPTIPGSDETIAIALSYFHPLACGVLIARNVLLVAAVVWTGVRVFRASSLTAARVYC